MVQAKNQSSEQDAGQFDLSQFYQVFFEEAGENLVSMETLLLAVDVDDPVEEDLHAIFRAAHSIKGGAATFGFQDVAELTHELETLLDRVRRHELNLTTQMVDTLLESGDVLKAQLARHKAGGEGEGEDTADLIARISTLASGEALIPVAKASVREIELIISQITNPEVVNNLKELFSDIPNLGTVKPIEGDWGEGVYHLHVQTESPDQELLDLFSFHVSREQVQINPLNAPPASSAAKPTEAAAEPAKAADSATPKAAEEVGYGFFVDPETLPVQRQTETAQASAPKVAAKPRADRAGPAAGPDTSTLRVSVEKVDQLINLVGELVITQAMLSTQGRQLDPIAHESMLSGLADLERNTRSLQDAVMGIRMIPMAVVFNRFPRMLRDLANKLGKEVELKTFGEATELDKGLIEKITDPLTHLVRNSVDHGIESPAKRVATGKPAQGTITLSAAHQGGSIVIEVRDDGAGLSRDRIMKKAQERGIPISENASDQEVWQLIFAPGFSTAEVITDVSGRGVGMDVVKKNIGALGGTVEVDSAPGYGTRVSVRLPLTLAIMDGMSVRVGDEIYIIPLASVVESFQVSQTKVKTVAGNQRVVDVRSEYLPVLAMDEMFSVPRFDWEKVSGTTVVVEADGVRIALLVDELVGQHQVVVKNLERNYKKVSGVSGATILGDGKVALIIDVSALVRRGRH